MRVSRQFDRRHRGQPAEVWWSATSAAYPYTIGTGRTPHRARVSLARAVRANHAYGPGPMFVELNAWEPDEEYLAEMQEWQDADFGTVLG